MTQLNDLLWSAIAAALAWAIYEYTGEPWHSLVFLALFCAVFLWLRLRIDREDRP